MGLFSCISNMENTKKDAGHFGLYWKEARTYRPGILVAERPKTAEWDHVTIKQPRPDADEPCLS